MLVLECIYTLVFATLVTETSAQISPYDLSINPSSVTVNEGQTIKADCTAKGDPVLSYTWSKDNFNSLVRLGQQLSISPASSSDSGTYVCRVTNSFGFKDKSINVTVQYAPKELVNQNKVFTAVIGSRIQLSCDTNALPPATSWSWTSDGTPLTNTDKVLSVYDTGKYTCRARNLVGYTDIEFFIYSKPDTGGGVSHAGTELSTAQIIAIVSVVAIAVLVLVAIFVCCCCADSRDTEDHPEHGLTTPQILAFGFGSIFCGLVIVAIVTCICCRDKLPQRCCKEKKKVAPETPPRRNMRYYEEPEDPRLRSLDIARFYRQPDVYREEKPSILPLDYGKDNVYISNTGIPKYYVTDFYTYDEMERQRRQRRKKKKSKKRKHRYHDDDLRDYKNILEDTTLNGDVSRKPISMDSYNHRNVIRTSPPDYEVVVGREFYREVD